MEFDVKQSEDELTKLEDFINQKITDLEACISVFRTMLRQIKQLKSANLTG